MCTSAVIHNSLGSVFHALHCILRSRAPLPRQAQAVQHDALPVMSRVYGTCRGSAMAGPLRRKLPGGRPRGRDERGAGGAVD